VLSAESLGTAAAWLYYRPAAGDVAGQGRE